jgi:hypothetical protein
MRTLIPGLPRLTLSLLPLLIAINSCIECSRSVAAEFAMLVQADNENERDEQGSGLIPQLRVPEIVGGRFDLPALGVMTTNMGEIGNGRVPESFREDHPADLIPLPESGSQRGNDPWNWSIAYWEAPDTFSFPLYFEDRMLERHGHVRLGHLQPLASGARFFATVPMLPYLMTIDGPCDCEYSLGHFRSGSCAPDLIQRPPLERRALIAEAVTLGSLIWIFP